VLHLPVELLMAGPIRPRWMYFVEKYLRVMKGYARQMARLEAYMAEGYITNEALKFIAKYCTSLDPKRGAFWTVEDDLKFKDKVLPKAFTKNVITAMVYEQAHKFVLTNHVAMVGWNERYKMASRRKSKFPSFRHWMRGTMLEALHHGENVSQEVLDISSGPNVKAKYFAGNIMHFTFSVRLCLCILY
jgi:hypothetical protein